MLTGGGGATAGMILCFPDNHAKVSVRFLCPLFAQTIRVWCSVKTCRAAHFLWESALAPRQLAFARRISPILPTPRRLNLAQMFLNSDLGRQSGPRSCFAVRNPSGPKLLFGGTASSARGVVKTSAAQLYPMYLISVSDFLEEATLRPHQQLLVDCKLELHGAQHTGRVIYVSHREWRV